MLRVAIETFLSKYKNCKNDNLETSLIEQRVFTKVSSGNVVCNFAVDANISYTKTFAL